MVEVVSRRHCSSRMAGSRLPIAVAHGEGYAEFATAGQRSRAQALVTLRFVDNRGAATEDYPYNPTVRRRASRV